MKTPSHSLLNIDQKSAKKKKLQQSISVSYCADGMVENILHKTEIIIIIIIIITQYKNSACGMSKQKLYHNNMANWNNL